MSFILDALRKSDQQRQRSVTPTLMSAQTPPPETRQPALFWYGMLAAVLVGAGILIGWMHQWQTEPAVALTPPPANTRPLETSTQRLPPAPLPVPAVSPSTLPEPPRATEAPPPAKALATPPQISPPPAVGATGQPARVEAPSQVPAASPALAPPPKAAAPVHEEPVRAAQTETAREAGVLALPELPPALQQEIPKLAILAHSYSSKPKSRFVYINDRMWHEEESPAPGLKLEQITPDGMIFSYKGYRFRRAANQ